MCTISFISVHGVGGYIFLFGISVLVSQNSRECQAFTVFTFSLHFICKLLQNAFVLYEIDFININSAILYFYLHRRIIALSFMSQLHIDTLNWIFTMCFSSRLQYSSSSKNNWYVCIRFSRKLYVKRPVRDLRGEGTFPPN